MGNIGTKIVYELVYWDNLGDINYIEIECFDELPFYFNIQQGEQWFTKEGTVINKKYVSKYEILEKRVVYYLLEDDTPEILT